MASERAAPLKVHGKSKGNGATAMIHPPGKVFIKLKSCHQTAALIAILVWFNLSYENAFLMMEEKLEKKKIINMPRGTKESLKGVQTTKACMPCKSALTVAQKIFHSDV